MKNDNEGVIIRGKSTEYILCALMWAIDCGNCYWNWIRIEWVIDVLMF